jgi:hypothetical protein
MEETLLKLLVVRLGVTSILRILIQKILENTEYFSEKGSVVLGGKLVNKVVHWNVIDSPIDELEVFNKKVDGVL